jgi:hypothetical protein
MKVKNLPEVGSRIRVVTRHKEIFYWATKPYRETLYEGEVVPSNKWDASSSFKLHTGNPDWPDSVIHLDNVHDITYLKGQAGRAVKSDSKVWTVTGSKGDKYTVSQIGTKWNCTCSGFQFRRNCKHVTEKQNA